MRVEELEEESDIVFGSRLSFVYIMATNNSTQLLVWPCLVFRNAKQLRNILQRRGGYDLRDALVDIMTYVQLGGRTTDSVAYLLGKHTPKMQRIVFCPELVVTPPSTIRSNNAFSFDSQHPSSSTCPMLQDALQEALRIQRKARVAEEQELHPLPAPGEHAPCA
jgi:hypothetical protein